MKLRLQTFSGIAPKISRQLLPDNMAVSARNCRLLSGELDGIGIPRLLHDFEDIGIKSAFRLPDAPNPDLWIGFTSSDVDFIDAPLINDTLERYVWTGSLTEQFVAVNTKARLRNGDPAYRHGMPGPVTPLVVGSVSGGTAELTETRAYTFTYVNEWGEESAPADPVLFSGPSDGTWNLNTISASAPDMTNRVPAAKRRIYRTVTGQASALFYFVAEINNMVATTYADSNSPSVVVQNNICKTWMHDVPPDDLLGLTAHPAGFLAAFKNNEVFFSEPYRTHAWPVPYILALEHDIVGLAIYGNMLMALTNSQPYYLSGTHPSNLSPTKSQSVEPCLAKRSIASTLQGVVYASPNGLVLFNEAGANIVSNQLISRDEWHQQFSPYTIKAAQAGMQYLAFKDEANGFEYSPAEPLGALSTFDRFTGIDNIQTDPYSGVVLIMATGIVYEWDHPDEPPVFYTWTSKEFDLPRALNFGAVIVKSEAIADVSEEEIEEEENLAAARLAWNTDRITRDLNPIAYTPIGGSRWQMTPTLGTPNFITAPDALDGKDRRRYPVGGSSLFAIGPQIGEGLGIDAAGVALLNVYADRKLVASLRVQPNKTMRLPSGFKAHYWQFEIIANITVYSIAVAETGKELMDV